jgi:acyl transferase domain-containing protein
MPSGTALEMSYIAIIGIGCRFPGANGPQEFWDLLRDGRCAVGEVPPDRFDIASMYDPTPATPGKVMSRWGGFLPDIQWFDANSFGISPREAAYMDPQQRLLLKTAWEALENAGQPIDEISGCDTGVFVGLWLNDYESRLFSATPETEFYMTTGTGRYAASGRLSYCLGLEGPSLTVDTACSSSLVAVHLACQSLRAGECSLAIAGGANVILQPHVTVAYSQSRMMAPDGRCKFGDTQADGYVRSEGAAMVVLKPLAQAIADRDPIYAVIRGSAVRNDGKSSGSLGTPSRAGQEALLRRAYRNAGISPGAVQYVEAHGTGTRAGDPIELGALGAVLAEGREAGRVCLAGSVKTNLGHTEGAAGIAGLIKTALALHHHAIPASLHCSNLNPDVAWPEIPVRVVRELADWPAPGDRIAGVSAFGISGTNAHVVVGEAPPREILPACQDRAFLLPISARAAESVRTLAGRYVTALDSDSSHLSDVCYTASQRRSHHPYRIWAVGETLAEVREQLQGELASNKTLEPATGQKVVFVFPGQGSQWFGMGRELWEREPVFRESLARSEVAMRPFVDWSLTEQLHADEQSPSYRLPEIDCIQPTLLAIEIGLAELWRSWGIEADAVIGHSMGEIAAAFVAGALTLDDAMRIVCCRSKLLRSTAGRGAMAVLELSIPETEAELVGLEGQLSIAVSNGPRSTVISGDPAAIEQVIESLEDRGVFCRPVRVDVASHSPQMDALKPELLALLEDVRPMLANVPIYSTCRAQIIDGTECDARYWADNLRLTVWFSGMTQDLLSAGYTVFIEMSPNPVLLPAIEQGFQYAKRSGVALPSLRRAEPEQKTILRSLGRLYELGSSLRWEGLIPAGNCVALPSYAWHEERFWCETEESNAEHMPQTGKASLRFRLGDPGARMAPPELKDMVRLLAGLEPGRRREEAMEVHLSELVAQVLRFTRGRIDKNQPFKTLGIDSLTTLELRNRLERTLNIKLSPTMLFNYPTVAALAPKLVEKMAIPRDPVTEDTTLALESGHGHLDALSKSELEDLLAKELARSVDFLDKSE